LRPEAPEFDGLEHLALERLDQGTAVLQELAENPVDADS